MILLAVAACSAEKPPMLPPAPDSALDVQLSGGRIAAPDSSATGWRLVRIGQADHLGTYALFRLVTSPATGKLHSELGMIRQIEVAASR